MTDAIHTVRLVGGRYDGDESQLEMLPPGIWAYTCAHDPRCDGFNGIHWIYGTDPGTAINGLEDVQEYRYSHPENDAHVYTWKPLMRDPHRGTREAMHA